MRLRANFKQGDTLSKGNRVQTDQVTPYKERTRTCKTCNPITCPQSGKLTITNRKRGAR